MNKPRLAIAISLVLLASGATSISVPASGHAQAISCLTGRACDGSPPPSSDPSPTDNTGTRELSPTGQVSDGVTVGSGSSVYKTHPAPKCDWRERTVVDEYVDENKDGLDDIGDDGTPIINTTITITRQPTGTYIYTPTTLSNDPTPLFDQITRDITQRFGENYNQIAPSVEAYYKPLADETKRIWVNCRPPDTNELERTYYPNAIDVALTDPMFDIEGEFRRLERFLVFDQPTFVEEDVLREWPGLVVRNPIWLSIDANDWTSQATPITTYRTNAFQLFGYPTGLSFDIDFTPHPDEPSRDGIDEHTQWDQTVDCLSEQTWDQGFTKSDRMPARPDLDEFSADLGRIAPCTWVPPMRGNVTITGRIDYHIVGVLNGITTRRQNRYQQFTTTWRTGELRAVNTNTPEP